MTHKKIAELIHVSTSTVSKALSGNPEISEEIAEKIRKVAIEGGYFKEKSKRRLKKSEKTLLIAVICPEITSIYYSSIITCLKNEIENRGGHLAVYINDFNADKMNAIIEMLILRGNTDGIIVFGKPRIAVPDALPILCMCDFIEMNDTAFDAVGVNSYTVIDDAVKYLKNLGHEKIGFVGEHNTIAKQKVFRETIKSNGLELNEDFIFTSSKRFGEIGIEAAHNMLKLKELPTAVIAAYDEVALALIHELTQNGISVPDDVSVMGINDIPSASYAQIPLTTVNTFSAEHYAIAVDILCSGIFGEKTSAKKIMIDHKIIERQTTKRRNLL